MRVLFLHNYYRYRGGEDLSFESDVQLLLDRGHRVLPMTLSNSDIPEGHWNEVKAAGRTLWNRQARHQVELAISRFKPDVMHCNNLFPQFSGSVYSPANRNGIAVVQALRNYRWFCSNSYLYRDGKVCTDCLSLPCAVGGIRHGCYRDSRTASGVVAAMQLMQRAVKRARDPVDVFFTPSKFAKEIYVRGGFDASRIAVKSNFIDPDPGRGPGNGDYAIFVGRLSVEKGVDVLIDAWNAMSRPPRLKIVGEGPSESSLQSKASANSAIEFLGHRDHSEILSLMGDAMFSVVPSVWYETFGRSMMESFARGTPVIASRLGAMQELVQDGKGGFLFEPGSVNGLIGRVQQFLSLSSDDVDGLRNSARGIYCDKCTAKTSYEQLLSIYRFAQQHAATRSSRGMVPIEQVPEDITTWPKTVGDDFA